MFIIGVDTNVTASGMSAFQKRIRSIGMDFSYQPELEQVTVAKTRTMFQTQVLKAGETDSGMGLTGRTCRARCWSRVCTRRRTPRSR